MVIYYNVYKTKEIPDCTKGKIEPQHIHTYYIKPSTDENVSFIQQIVFLYFVFSCTSSSLVQGIPVEANSRSSRDQLPKRVRKSNDLNQVFPAPTVTQEGQLFSRTGYFLVILPNGTIETTLNNSSIYSK